MHLAVVGFVAHICVEACNLKANHRRQGKRQSTRFTRLLGPPSVGIRKG
jgi:hypothetical protein